MDTVNNPGVGLLAQQGKGYNVKRTPETEFVKFIKQNEEELLFEYLDRKGSRAVRLAVNFMHKMALRRSEAIKINIDDIDFENKTLTVMQPKTKKIVYRIIPDLMILRLKTYIKQHKKEIEKHNGYLCFPGGENPKYSHKDHIEKSTVSYFFHKFRIACNLAKPYYIRKDNKPLHRIASHVFRSNWITKMYKTLIDQGHNHMEALKTVQREIGHKNIETTMKYIRFENVKTMAKEGVNSLFGLPLATSDSHNVQSHPETH